MKYLILSIIDSLVNSGWIFVVLPIMAAILIVLLWKPSMIISKIILEIHLRGEMGWCKFEKYEDEGYELRPSICLQGIVISILWTVVLFLLYCLLYH